MNNRKIEFLVGCSLAMMAILAELIAVNRQLIEKLSYRQQLMEVNAEESLVRQSRNQI